MAIQLSELQAWIWKSGFIRLNATYLTRYKATYVEKNQTNVKIALIYYETSRI